jgi:hypothetical protein
MKLEVTVGLDKFNILIQYKKQPIFIFTGKQNNKYSKIYLVKKKHNMHLKETIREAIERQKLTPSVKDLLLLERVRSKMINHGKSWYFYFTSNYDIYIIFHIWCNQAISQNKLLTVCLFNYTRPNLQKAK